MNLEEELIALFEQEEAETLHSSAQKAVGALIRLRQVDFVIHQYYRAANPRTAKSVLLSQ
jgi:hypothetical protein